MLSGDLSCLMHLSGSLKRTGYNTRNYHLSQVLDPPITRSGT